MNAESLENHAMKGNGVVDGVVSVIRQDAGPTAAVVMIQHSHTLAEARPH